MKETPTSGPISSKNTHHERELISSRHSLRNSQTVGLRERKKDLLEIIRRNRAVPGSLLLEFGECALRDNIAPTQQHEAIANFGSIGDLVNRHEHGASTLHMLAQYRIHFAALTQIQSFKRFVDDQHR